MQKYSFRDCSLIVNIIEGFAEGDDVVTGDRRNPAFTDKVGADGRMMVNQSADRSGSFKFKLMQDSEGSNILGELFSRQERGGGVSVSVGGFSLGSNPFGSISVSFKNHVSGHTIKGMAGYIPKPAATARGSNANADEWEIVVEDYDSFFGALPLITANVSLNL